MDYIEFSAKIKEKYPEYKDVDDLTLAQKIVEKYPEYKEKVTFEVVNTVTTSTPKTAKKGIDLTPSGIANTISSNIAAGISAPIDALHYNKPIGEAFSEAKDRIDTARANDKAARVQDFLTDMAGYYALPVLRGGGAARFLGNAAIQGGIPGAAESLKRGGNAVGGAGVGTGIVAALQGITPQAGKIVNKALESDVIKKNLPKILEGLTSVPAEYSERALEKELAGQSILNGKFDADTAYIPIERKLRQAKDMLPTAEDFAGEYYNLGKKAAEGFENLKNAAGQEISEMLGKLGNEPVDIGGLKNSLEGLINSYAKGGTVNPAEIRAGRDLEQVKDLLGIKSKQDTAKELGNYYNSNKIGAISGGEMDKEAERIAFDILSQATGKDARWLKSQLNANLPKQSTQKRQEFIQELLDSTADKIDNIDPLWQQYFPEFNFENLQGGGADTSELVRGLFDKILNKDFKNTQKLILPEEMQFEELGKQYNNLMGKVAANPSKKVVNESYNSLQQFIKDMPDDLKEYFSIKYADDIESLQNIAEPKVKPIDLHNIKELLYDIANYDTAGGIRNDAIKGVANQINNFIRHIEPNYQRPNDIFSLIKSVEKDAGGLNVNTLGKKIADIGSKGNLVSGLDARLKNIDYLLPSQSKFFKQAQSINAERDAIDNINRTIGQQYERNPRLLANRTDEGFETAINDLQKRTGVNFMDELNDTRAREALEKFFPGQGGGSGSSQGFGNLLRTALLGGSPVAAVTMHNPAALAGLGVVSPKLMAKGTIKNIGKLSETAKKAATGAYDEILNRLSQLGAKGAANMLYGGVEYNDYK